MSQYIQFAEAKKKNFDPGEYEEMGVHQLLQLSNNMVEPSEVRRQAQEELLRRKQKSE